MGGLKSDRGIKLGFTSEVRRAYSVIPYTVISFISCYKLLDIQDDKDSLMAHKNDDLSHLL